MFLSSPFIICKCIDSEAKNFFVCRKALIFLICVLSKPAFVLAADDLLHIFRRFSAATIQPHFHDGVKTAFKEFNMILNKPIVEMFFAITLP